MYQIGGTWECNGGEGCPHFLPRESGSNDTDNGNLNIGICMRWSQSPCIRTGKYAEWALTPETRAKIAMEVKVQGTVAKN